MTGPVIADGLRPGLDFRRPEYRRATFIRFYLFHCRYRSHPGGVYFLLPHLREHYGWSAEQALWFAFLNGNTQHPVTSWLLHQRCPEPTSRAGRKAMLAFYHDQYFRLAWDTDRRHWKKSLEPAVESYLRALEPYGGSQEAMWNAAALDGFSGIWRQATALYSMGRLSAFSYSEYLRIVGIDFDCDNLFLGDMQGSRSHRNGLCIVTGRDRYDWHSSNLDFPGHYPPEMLEQLDVAARDLLAEARRRAEGQDWARDVGLFTLESALCTYKGWHRVNRRYPNVYMDMLYDRLRLYEQRWPQLDLSIFWQARRDWLPPHLRLEDNPYDPGLVPVKMNHYRTTGQPVMMSREYPVFANDFEKNVELGVYGLRRDLRKRHREVLR